MLTLKALLVPRCRVDVSSLDAVDACLDTLDRHPLEMVNWPDWPYCPTVDFSLAHTGADLLLKFRVTEQSVLAEKTETNQPVCQDSCVEMFFSPRADVYLNLEFNCIGTLLVGRGSCRADSRVIDPQRIATIRRRSSLGSQPFGERIEATSWSLVAVVPFALLELTDVRPGTTCRANFYKCGDRLTVPHYVTWNPIEAPAPDFHRPECFGQLTFE